jgi:hypothetical protein
VLYTPNAPIGGSAPVWNDQCPTPPGPTTDGCVVSSRLSRLQAAGNVMRGTEQVPINDWCRQVARCTQVPATGRALTSRITARPVEAPAVRLLGTRAVTRVRGVGWTPDAAERRGGALRIQDVRTLAPRSGGGFAGTVLADSPVSYLAPG